MNWHGISLQKPCGAWLRADPLDYALMKLLCVVGARPNFMKMAPLLEAMKAYPHLQPTLVHTGQHYDAAMSDVFFTELGMPRPDLSLGVGSGSHATQTAKIMLAFEDVCLAQKPEAVVVVGDVNSTLAAALVAAKLEIPVAHVEAGLRSFDRSMPEEINRLLTDQISHWCFVTEPAGMENLAKENIPAGKCHLTGNVMVDTLQRYLPKAKALNTPSAWGLSGRAYGLLTLHRPANVDDPAIFRELFGALGKIARQIPLLFAVHPRTAQRMKEHHSVLGGIKIEQGAAGLPAPGLYLLPPQPYLAFLSLMQGAALVLTDSGGIQEETTVLGVPCLTLRENTERPVTVEQGTNTLVGLHADGILQAAEAVLAGHGKQGVAPDLWDGHAAERISAILTKPY